MKSPITRTIFGILVICFIFLIGSSIKTPSSYNSNTVKTIINIKPVCDGTSVTTSCTHDGITYSKYLYHPGTLEKSHISTITTYTSEITGYCTLCNDYTYSPSCATGRGACSYHGGVAVWNAPVYENVPHYTYKKIVDIPAQEPYYEKVI